MVDAAHQGDIGGNGRLHLEAQVIQQFAVVIAECFFVQADVCVVTDAFKEAEAQPGLHPQPGADTYNSLREALGLKIGIGSALVVFPTALLLGDVAEQIRLQFERQGTGAPDPSLQTDAQYGFRSHVPVKQEGVAESGVNHLTAPSGDRPGMGMPVGNRRQQRWACQRLGCRRGGCNGL